MTAGRIRLVVVMTHPVQYLSPWFRHIHAHAASLDLTVVYATEPTAAQQGVGFGQAFAWDVPLRDGYSSVVVRAQMDHASLDSGRFFGINVAELPAAVQRLEPDVVLVPGWHSITQVRTIFALRRAGIPLLYRGDTHLDSSSARWPRLSRMRARLLLRQFSGYLAVGSKSREYLRAMGVADPAIVASPHAVDNTWFRVRAGEARERRQQLRDAYGFSPDDRVVLYAGKLTAIKRPADVIDAVAAMENAAALIVGNGPQRTLLEAHASARGVRAVFTGFLNQEQIVGAYVAADALMLPGRETWGLVANEALACGLPVVVSPTVGAAVDLATPNVCVVVPRGDTAGFAAALTSVINHRRNGGGTTADSEAVAERCSYEAATRGLVTAATFAVHQRQRMHADAPVRVVALCGNLVFAGGMERITFEALGALVRGGAGVHALVNSWSSRPIAELAERANVTWQVGHYDARLDGVFRHPLRMARALLDVALASGQLLRLIAIRRVTHVMAVDFRAVLLHAPALFVARLIGVDVVLRSGVAPTPTPLHARLWRGVIRPLVSRHIANSAFTAAELQAIGIPADRIETIPNIAPARSESVSPARPERNRIAYVGQVIPQKGVLHLLDAVAILVRRGYDVSLDIVGSIDGWATADVHAYRERVRTRVAEPDLRNRVRLLGWREDIDQVLQAAAVHCCPSQPEQREGFGITVVEAKRAGVPSVVCPSGALPELISHQHDGWVTTGFDAAAIAEGLEWFLSDSERLADARTAALVSARRFDPAVFEARWHEVFGLQSAGRGRNCALADAQGTWQ